MNDDILTRLDESLAKREAGGRLAGRAAAAPRVPTIVPAPAGRTLRDRLPWVDLFVGIQFLWGLVLFLPGSQALRPVVRALPYAASVALLAMFLPRMMKRRAPAGTVPLLFSLVLLVANLLHPTSQLASGVAQCIFQVSIAAPLFWGWRAVSSTERLRRTLWIALLLNLLGAALGVLQVYYPDRFMPPQFSTLGLRMNELYVESLTYVGATGERIVRPPGLTDQPGGAAVAGALAVVLGAGLSLGARTPLSGGVALASVGIGLAAIYLTQVRALLLMAVVALAALASMLFKRGQVRSGMRITVAAAVLVVGSFVWARSVGGESVADRFLGITQQGAMRTYQETRGGFVTQTFGELLDQYPLGAGVGRWGMMFIYFGDPVRLDSPPIHVEIQPTGWLLDGGLPMWGLCGAALLFALYTSYRLSLQRLSPQVAETATVVLVVQVLVIGFGWASPVFNTQLGLLFWFLSSALYGAATAEGVFPGRRILTPPPGSQG